MDQSAIDEVAKIFLRARQTGERLDPLPAHLKPKDFADSRAVMAALDALVGERILGTKIAAIGSALAAVLKGGYVPAKRNGEPIVIPFTIRVDFRVH